MNEKHHNGKRHWRSALIGGCCLLTSFAAQADSSADGPSQRAELYPTTTTYGIWRKGKNIGSHRLSISTENNDVSVEVETNIKITVLKVPVFRFTHTASEAWKNGQLVAVEARTDRGGDDITEVSLTEDMASKVDFATNHWNMDVVQSSSVFNTLTGNLNTVSIEQLENETLSAQGIDVNSTHFRYTGDFDADVWYDDAGRWIQLQFKADDGSKITYIANPIDFKP